MISRGPIIHGIGVRSDTHTKAAIYPANKVHKIRRMDIASGREFILANRCLVDAFFISSRHCSEDGSDSLPRAIVVHLIPNQLIDQVRA